MIQKVRGSEEEEEVGTKVFSTERPDSEVKKKDTAVKPIS